MTPSAQVPVEALEVGPRLGTGAQGSIYAVHRAPVDGDGPLAFKRFHATIAAAPVGVDALVRFRERLDADDRQLLDERTTWPRAAVVGGGRTIGYLVRALAALVALLLWGAWGR